MISCHLHERERERGVFCRVKGSGERSGEPRLGLVIAENVTQAASGRVKFEAPLGASEFGGYSSACLMLSGCSEF